MILVILKPTNLNDCDAFIKYSKNIDDLKIQIDEEYDI